MPSYPDDVALPRHFAGKTIRTLLPEERPGLLELLDGWQLGDGWRGRDFFRRYIDDDPTFAEDNVWVAAEGQELLACVQIFPRRMRTLLGEQALGGIGSVYTRPERRGEGIAGVLVRTAVADMARRGFVLSLLFAELVDWYGRLGWLPWSVEGLRLLPPARPESALSLAGGRAIRPMRPESDLEEIAALHATYSSNLLGTLVRDRELWLASLCCAGNPDETFLVARQDERLLAYLRATLLEGETTLTEWGAEPGRDDALVDLIDRVVARHPGSTSLQLPRAVDDSLARTLTRRGYRLRVQPRLAAMLRPLSPAAPHESPAAETLERFVPRDRFAFWLADRF